MPLSDTPLGTEKILSIKLCHLNYVDCHPIAITDVLKYKDMS